MLCSNHQARTTKHHLSSLQRLSTRAMKRGWQHTLMLAGTTKMSQKYWGTLTMRWLVALLPMHNTWCAPGSVSSAGSSDEAGCEKRAMAIGMMDWWVCRWIVFCVRNVGWWNCLTYIHINVCGLVASMAAVSWWWTPEHTTKQHNKTWVLATHEMQTTHHIVTLIDFASKWQLKHRNWAWWWLHS